MSFPKTKEEFEEMKKRAEAKGIYFETKWRKGLKTIKIAPIVLSENYESDSTSQSTNGGKIE